MASSRSVCCTEERGERRAMCEKEPSSGAGWAELLSPGALRALPNSLLSSAFKQLEKYGLRCNLDLLLKYSINIIKTKQNKKP